MVKRGDVESRINAYSFAMKDFGKKVTPGKRLQTTSVEQKQNSFLEGKKEAQL